MQNELKMTKARWWEKADENAVSCQLCPRSCMIGEGKRGFCQVRENKAGEFYSLSYGYPVALHVDPIEKKPLAEFMPGTKTFSIGTFGCNLNCCFCQNYHLSRGTYSEHQRCESEYASPELIVALAPRHACSSIAFTYNEPTVFAEYALDIATLAKKAGIPTVLVSNGYITLEAARDLYPLIDAANIDMKGFSEEFYGKMCGAKLKPVLEAMEYFHKLGKHLEITNLVIPGKNDSPEMIGAFLDWVEASLDKNVPIHFSAYHPDYQYQKSPPTPSETLYAIREEAQRRGFGHVYLGNIH